MKLKGAMYEFAYNDVIEDSHKTMRARERAAMDRVIALLRAAQEKGPQVARTRGGAVLPPPPVDDLYRRSQ